MGALRLVAGSEKPRIQVTPDMESVVNAAIVALKGRSDVYQRGGSLVRVVDDEGVPRIRGMAPATLHETLAGVAEWFAYKATSEGGEWRRCLPPKWAVEAVGARGQWPGVPVLRGVTEAPALRPDGSILQRTGYDAATGLYFKSAVAFPRIPDRPSREQARVAAETLLDLVRDFPFAGDAHRSAWLAGLLTPFSRSAFVGPAPLFLVDANTRGSGKGLLVDAAAHVYSPRGVGRFSQAVDDAEERKCITSLALRGVPLVLFDNLSRPFGSGPLDAALTSVDWSDRVLNTNDMPTLPLLATFWATGNNVSFRSGADTARRTLHVRLESPEENPERRVGFTHRDLLGHVKENRPALVAAALTILRGYCAAGRPEDCKLSPWGSFEAWSALVRGAIVWAGYADPFATHEGLVEVADTDAAALGGLLDAWQDLCEKDGPTGCTAADAVSALEQDRVAKSTRYQKLKDALGELVHIKPGTLPDAKLVGKVLKSYRERVVGGRRLVRLDAKSNAGVRYVVRRVTDRAAEVTKVTDRHSDRHSPSATGQGGQSDDRDDVSPRRN